jgi:hypothetical protein
MTDRSPRTPPALSNATPRPFADNLRKVAIRGGGLGEGRLCLVCFAASHFDPHTSTDTLKHEPDCPVAAAPPVAEGPAATPRGGSRCILCHAELKPSETLMSDGLCTQCRQKNAAAAEPFTPNAAEARAAASKS